MADTKTEKNPLDRYIISFKHLFLTMLAITLYVSFYYYEERVRNDEIERSLWLQTIFSSYEAMNSPEKHPEAIEENLLKFLFAASLTSEPKANAGNPLNKIVDSYRNENPIQNTVYFSTTQMRSHYDTRSECEAVAYQGPPSDSAFIQNIKPIDHADTVPMNNVYLVNFSLMCKPMVHGLTNLLFFKLQDARGWLIGELDGKNWTVFGG